MRTLAEILGAALPDNAAEDSVSFLPALLGRALTPLREAIVHHSIDGSFVIRQGKWKLAFCPGSGGWSSPRPDVDDASNLPLVQLFDLSTDLAEGRNLEQQHPEVVAHLTKLMERYAATGRSTPGSVQPNDGPVNIWEAGRAAHQPVANRKGKKK
jgi:hypothetical protein